MNEIKFFYDVSNSIYVFIWNAADQVYNHVSQAFETVVETDEAYANYAIYLTESGNLYAGDFPSAITTPGVYYISAYTVEGNSSGFNASTADPIIGEGEIVWNGSDSEEVTIGNNLITLGYAKANLGITITDYDLILGRYITAATYAIQRYCRKHFLPNTYSEYYDGPGDCKLILNQTPIVSLTSVILNPYGDAPETISGSSYIVDVKSGIIQLKPTGTATRYFCEGFQNVQVSYQAGYDPIPDDLQEACAILVANMYYARQTDRTVLSEKIGDYAITYRQAFALMSPDVLALLAPYRSFIV